MAGKSVLITGANRGLGLEFVRQFLKQATPPKHIFAVCRDPAKAEDLKKISVANPSVHLLGLEITDPKQYDKAVAEVKGIVGPAGLNVLVNNAGIFDWNLSSLEAHTKENMMQHLDINAVTPVLLAKAFLPLLKDAGAGSKEGCVNAAVVNISAVLGCIHLAKEFPGGYPYKYSKAALNMATHCLAEDLKPSGILVMALHPGWVRTDMGGPNGDLSPEESVGGCVNIVTSLQERHRGKLFKWNGEEVPY